MSPTTTIKPRNRTNRSRVAGPVNPVARRKPNAPFSLAISTTAAHRRHVPYLRRMLRRAHALIRTHVRDLSIAVVGDAKMAELHESFMGIPGPTDVLTFELDHDPRGRVTAGEVVVNVAEARRRAPEHGVSPADELLLYAIHGLLHLSGHDDTTKSAYAKMHRKEDQILTHLGVGRVFAAPAGDSARLRTAPRARNRRASTGTARRGSPA